MTDPVQTFLFLLLLWLVAVWLFVRAREARLKNAEHWLTCWREAAGDCHRRMLDVEALNDGLRGELTDQKAKQKRLAASLRYGQSVSHKATEADRDMWHGRAVRAEALCRSLKTYRSGSDRG